jgi:hypothetical protein
MDKFRNMTVYLTISCDDNPVLTSIMIFFAFLFTNSILAHIESLIFGEPIRYWFDVFLGCLCDPCLCLSENYRNGRRKNTNVRKWRE